jgi:hypothetical protein
VEHLRDRERAHQYRLRHQARSALGRHTRLDLSRQRGPHAYPRTRRVERKPERSENGREWKDHERIVSSEPWPEAQARADEIVAASKRLTAEKRRRRDVSGFTEATAACDAARERHYASMERIAAVRAKTPRGAALKAAVIAGSYEDDLAEMEAEIQREDYGLDVRLALSIARDLSQMAGAPVA